MVPVGLTDRAEAEWDAVYQWWAENRFAEQAVRWYNGIADAIQALADRPAQWPLARENSRTTYELRERHFGLSRKWAIPILEHLDAQRVTHRVGDKRRLVRSAST